MSSVTRGHDVLSAAWSRPGGVSQAAAASPPPGHPPPSLRPGRWPSQQLSATGERREPAQLKSGHLTWVLADQPAPTIHIARLAHYSPRRRRGVAAKAANGGVQASLVVAGGEGGLSATRMPAKGRLATAPATPRAQKVTMQESPMPCAPCPCRCADFILSVREEWLLLDDQLSRRRVSQEGGGSGVPDCPTSRIRLSGPPFALRHLSLDIRGRKGAFLRKVAEAAHWYRRPPLDSGPPGRRPRSRRLASRIGFRWGGCPGPRPPVLAVLYLVLQRGLPGDRPRHRSRTSRRDRRGDPAHSPDPCPHAGRR